jgi:ATP-dependent Lon protease
VAIQFVEGRTEPFTVQADDLNGILGPERFVHEKLRQKLPPGVAAGLAWTSVGGEVLYVETVLIPESRDLAITGQLGDVMQESARTARAYILSRADDLGIDRERIKTHGVHLHVPAGATPKDGPSAGITIATAMASLYAGSPVRSDAAMTGEISLSGLVLPVGGIKEKVLAAHRAGMKRVILPRENEKDLRELPDHVRESIEFLFAEHVDEVLAAAIPQVSEATHAAAPAGS